MTSHQRQYNVILALYAHWMKAEFIEKQSTIDKIRSGFLPYTSEAAPITGEAMNCSSENREPIKPEKNNTLI